MDSELISNADTPIRYQWVDCNNNFTPIVDETEGSFFPTESGTYAVELAIQQINSYPGCITMSECVDYMLVSTDEVVEAFGLSIYPNPTNDFVILGKETSEVLDVITYNLLGEKVFSLTADKAVSNIDLSDFAAGTYHFSP